MEDILCRRHYESTAPLGTHITLPIPEQHCKIPAVQGPLAMLKGWDVAFSSIPGLLLAVPYGYVADKYGRKIVLILGALGVTLSLVWTQIVRKFCFQSRWKDRSLIYT
jgi:MFS family permease